MANINKIYLLAKDRGVKLSYICSKLGLARTYFADVRNKKTEIPNDRLIIIADILSTTLEYLKDETDEPEKPAGGRTVKPTDDDIKFALFNGDKDITDEMYEEVKQFAQFVKDKNKNKK